MRKNILLLIFAIIISLISNACNPENNPSDPSYLTGKCKVSGIIIDKDSNAIEGVEIKIGNNIVVSNSKGIFSINNIAESDEIKIKFKKEGFIDNYKIIRTFENQNNQVKSSLIQKSKVISVNQNKGSFNTNNVSVSYLDNSFVLTNGEVISSNINLEATYVNNLTNNFNYIFPGKFESNRKENFVALGFIDLNGNINAQKVDLAKGKYLTLNISFYEFKTNFNLEKDNIGIYSFDEESSKWNLETYLKFQNGSFNGKVSKLKLYCFAQVYKPSYLKAKVVNNKGKIISNAKVVSEGQNVTTLNTSYSDQNGNFEMPFIASQKVNIEASFDESKSLVQVETSPAENEKLEIKDIKIFFDELLGWQKLVLPVDDEIQSIFKKDSSFVYIIGKKYFFTSTDGGENWSYQNNFIEGNFGNIYFISNLMGWIYTSNNNYKTIDGGLSWKLDPIKNDYPTFSIDSNGIGFKDDYTNNNILITNDFGKNWSIFSNYKSYFDKGNVSCQKIYHSGSQFVSTTLVNIISNVPTKYFSFNTTNGGSSWNISQSSDEYGISNFIATYSTASYKIGLGSLGSSTEAVIWIEKLGIRNFHKLPLNIGVDLRLFVKNPMNMWIVNGKSELYYSNDEGISWSFQPSKFDSKISYIFFISENNSIVATQNKNYYFTKTNGM